MRPQRDAELGPPNLLLLDRVDPAAARLRRDVGVVTGGGVGLCGGAVRVRLVVGVVLVLVVGVDDGGQPGGRRRFHAEVVVEVAVAGAQRAALTYATVVHGRVHRGVA